MGSWKQTVSRPVLSWLANRNSPIRFHNFWDYTSIRDLWFYRFIRHRRILEKAGIKRINFYSVFGNRWITDLMVSKKTPSVFFTGENLENYPKYADHMLGQVRLSIGFEYLSHPDYLRFPLWILYIIQPEWGIEEISKHLELKFQSTVFKERNGFCCLVASHDRNGIRQRIMNEVRKVGEVSSGGKMYNNTNALRNEFHNDKSAFLKAFKMNICPENSNTPGYVTEKLFQALEAGCIPLYWGSDLNPEPEILNKEAIWFYDDESGLKSDFRDKLQALKQDPQVYQQWCQVPKFLPGANVIINSHLDQLEARLIHIAKNKF